MVSVLLNSDLISYYLKEYNALDSNIAGRIPATIQKHPGLVLKYVHYFRHMGGRWPYDPEFSDQLWIHCHWSTLELSFQLIKACDCS